jgi:hypothetical protein
MFYKQLIYLDTNVSDWKEGRSTGGSAEKTEKGERERERIETVS